MTTTTPQTPAEGILQFHDHGSAKSYKVSCECGQGDDEIFFDVEADDFGVTAHHYVKVKTSWWKEAWPKDYNIKNDALRWLQCTAAHFVNSLCNRVSITWTLWTKGYVEYEAWTMMSKQQTVNYAHTLLSAVEDVEKFRNDRKTNNEQSN